MWHELREDVEDELARLDRALIESEGKRNELLDLDAEVPSSWDRLAAAGVMHECYTGIENSLKRIAKVVDRRLPEGASWHVDLLRQVATPTNQRAAAISPELHRRLGECLELRHIARTHYSFDLDWQLLRVHVASLPSLVTDFADAMRQFLGDLDRRAEQP